MIVDILPFPKQSLLELRNCLTNDGLYLSSDATVVFVCGAKPSPKAPRARDSFLQYANRNLKSYRFFMAEDFFNLYERRMQKDLLSVEGDIAKFCDCLIVFIESASAIAELGAFATHDELSKIMLAVNDDEHRNSDSFISLGPIAKINRQALS